MTRRHRSRLEHSSIKGDFSALDYVVRTLSHNRLRSHALHVCACVGIGGPAAGMAAGMHCFETWVLHYNVLLLWQCYVWWAVKRVLKYNWYVC
jgi:hypothetical protein